MKAALIFAAVLLLLPGVAPAQARKCAVTPYTNPDGVFSEPYTGGCKAGRAHGAGQYGYVSPNVIPRGTMRVKGNFAGGVLQGKARIDFPNGAWFEGVFSGNLREGPGRLVNPNGTWATGVWRGGKNWDVTGVGLDKDVRYSYQFVAGKQAGLCRADNPYRVCLPNLQEALAMTSPPVLP